MNRFFFKYIKSDWFTSPLVSLLLLLACCAQVATSSLQTSACEKQLGRALSGFAKTAKVSGLQTKANELKDGKCTK